MNIEDTCPCGSRFDASDSVSTGSTALLLSHSSWQRQHKLCLDLVRQPVDATRDLLGEIAADVSKLTSHFTADLDAASALGRESRIGHAESLAVEPNWNAVVEQALYKLGNHYDPQSADQNVGDARRILNALAQANYNLILKKS